MRAARPRRFLHVPLASATLAITSAALALTSATLALTSAALTSAALAITSAALKPPSSAFKLQRSDDQRLDVLGRLSRAVQLLHNKPDPMRSLSPRADQ